MATAHLRKLAGGDPEACASVGRVEDLKGSLRKGVGGMILFFSQSSELLTSQIVFTKLYPLAI